MGSHQSTQQKYASLVYPIKRVLRFEVDNVSSLTSERHSQLEQIGGSFWSISVEKVHSDGSAHFSIYLRNWSLTGKNQEIPITFRSILIHPDDPEKNLHCGGTKTLVCTDGHGFSEFTSWENLMSAGFVEDDRITIECYLKIEREVGVSRRMLDFEKERPNNEDVEVMVGDRLKGSIYTEVISTNIAIDKVSTDSKFNEAAMLEMIPCKLYYHQMEKHNATWLAVYAHLNDSDDSEWWRLQLTLEFKIINKLNPENTLSHVTPIRWFQVGEDNWGIEDFILWEELIKPENGFVEDGEFQLECKITFYKMLGVNEDGGLVKPMRELTDASLVVEGRSFQVSKQMLSHYSTHFKTLFDENEGEYDFEIFLVESTNVDDFARFLSLIHDSEMFIEESQIENLLKTIKHYDAPECYARLDRRICKQGAKNLTELIKLTDEYPLPETENLIYSSFGTDLRLGAVRDHETEEFKAFSDELKEKIRNWKAPEDSDDEQLPDLKFDERSASSNVKIIVEGVDFYVNRQVLANASHYFLNKFYSPESSDLPELMELELDNTDARAFDLLLKYIYHPSTPIQNVDVLLQLAHRFGVPRLMDKCEEHLVLSLNVSLKEKIGYAEKFDLPYLMSSCLLLAEQSDTLQDLQLSENFQEQLDQRIKFSGCWFEPHE